MRTFSKNYAALAAHHVFQRHMSCQHPTLVSVPVPRNRRKTFSTNVCTTPARQEHLTMFPLDPPTHPTHRFCRSVKFPRRRMRNGAGRDFPPSEVSPPRDAPTRRPSPRPFSSSPPSSSPSPSMSPSMSTDGDAPSPAAPLLLCATPKRKNGGHNLFYFWNPDRPVRTDVGPKSSTNPFSRGRKGRGEDKRMRIARRKYTRKKDKKERSTRRE